jgi:hypothetical protein
LKKIIWERLTLEKLEVIINSVNPVLEYKLSPEEVTDFTCRKKLYVSVIGSIFCPPHAAAGSKSFVLLQSSLRVD